MYWAHQEIIKHFPLAVDMSVFFIIASFFFSCLRQIIGCLLGSGWNVRWGRFAGGSIDYCPLPTQTPDARRSIREALLTHFSNCFRLGSRSIQTFCHAYAWSSHRLSAHLTFKTVANALFFFSPHYTTVMCGGGQSLGEVRRWGSWAWWLCMLNSGSGICYLKGPCPDWVPAVDCVILEKVIQVDTRRPLPCEIIPLRYFLSICQQRMELVKH